MTVRCGLVGTGGIGALHAKTLEAGGRRFEVCFDADAARAKSFGEAYGADVCGSYDEWLERCDAVWVCTPPSAHLEAVERAADAGNAVFCEKPLAPSLPEARKLVQAASTVPSQVGLVLRSLDAYARVREMV